MLAPAGDGGLPWMEAAQVASAASEDRPAVLATGTAGDVFLCHPFLVHAASWPHAGTTPKLMAQPGIILHDAFPLTQPISPVEEAIIPALGR